MGQDTRTGTGAQAAGSQFPSLPPHSVFCSVLPHTFLPSFLPTSLGRALTTESAGEGAFRYGLGRQHWAIKSCVAQRSLTNG